MKTEVNKISIIIPLYKPDKIILDSLINELKSNNKDIELLFINGKDGLANAYNLGIKKAKGDIIITIHQDCFPLENDSIKKLIKPFEDKEVVLSYGWGIELYEISKDYPFIPDGKFTAFRKSALKEVGLFDEEHFKYGGEDVDIFLKLKKIGKIKRVDTGYRHFHKGYKTNKSKEKIKQNGNINGALFRIWGFKYSKWFKALVLCLIYPSTYGKEFTKAFVSKQQNYRRKE